ncbi:L,D-transpeptidase family protein [Salinarimonas rosea]|uniref:L,D-transpeptidase family protein n=1 Tax=Salinarimonas rosea TaxID=552063 RepID=UPI00041BFD18|nr:L,D-transpeptidase family protein [Salinarimonas rosea]
MPSHTLSRIAVYRAAGPRHRGRLVAGSLVLPCALGRGGIRRDKREGDGATPAGTVRPLGAFFRADRGSRPATLLPLAVIREADGWCDAPGDRNYNRPVLLPYPASAERMRRDDALYDIVVDLSANRGPIRKGRGSAIFLHVAKPGFLPTEGCIALEKRALRRLLARIGPRTRFVVG